ncbi:MAG: AsmA-like C-terminal region-containing protein, partial [bacterium]|nr:AsmA-like C-terminal region-containing protein [bacterium]
SLRLGEGEWKGQVTLGYSAPNLLASSSGSIAGVQVNELLGAFTTAEDAVYGVATIPGYSISGSGKDAEELRNALTGKGSIDVAEGRVALFDLVGTIERHAKKLLGGETAAEGETSFVRLSSKFDIGGQRINLSDVRLEGKSANVRGQGYITFDQELNLDLNAGIRGSVAKLVGGAPDGDGVPVAAIPVTIRGTVESPKVRPAIGKIAVKKALGLFESLFQKEEEEEEAGQAPQTEP